MQSIAKSTVSGKHGLPSTGLPPNAACLFRVRLESADPPPEDKSALPLEQKMEHGRRKKDRGNQWYAKEEFQMAIQCYRCVSTL